MKLLIRDVFISLVVSNQPLNSFHADCCLKTFCQYICVVTHNSYCWSTTNS